MLQSIYDFFEFVIYVIGGGAIAVIAIILAPYIIKYVMKLIYNIIGKIGNISINKRNKEIKFDEFGDISKIKNQEEKEAMERKHEYAVLEQVYEEAFKEKFDEQDKEKKSSLTMGDIIDAQKKVKEVKKDLYDFKILDSVEIKDKRRNEGAHINDIKESQEDFDAELFKNWSAQIFKCIKIGKKEELQILKKVMTEQMYNNLIFQLNEFNEDGLEFVTEDLMIEEVSLADYGKSMSKEEIRVFVKAKMKEYIIQKDNLEVIRGSNKKLIERKIVMTFLKQNKEDEEGFITNCPNCGAETKQVEFGKCEYCNTLVFPIRYNWTLTKFETI